jgi:hypothetical protein
MAVNTSKIGLKVKIAEAVSAFTRNNGYSESLVEKMEPEILNFIDIIGDSKSRDFFALLYNVTNADDVQITESKSGMSQDLRHEIIELIRSELNSTNRVVSKTADVPDFKQPEIETAVEKNVPETVITADPENAKKISEQLALKVTECVGQDISTLVNEKVLFKMENSALITGDELLKSGTEAVMTMEALRSNGQKIIIRAAAKEFVRVAGIMSIMPQTVLEDKIKTLNLNDGDIEVIKEVFNQATGSINRAIGGEKFKLGTMIVLDQTKEHEFYGNTLYAACNYSCNVGTETYNNFYILIPVNDAALI